MDRIGLNKINEIITEKIAQGYCIFVLTASLGDTLLFFEYKKYIEQKHNLKIFSIVLRRQKFIPEYINEKEFVRIDNLRQIFELDITNKLYPDAKGDLCNIGKLHPSPEKGHYFIAHTNGIPGKNFVNSFDPTRSTMREYQAFLYDLDDYNLYDREIYTLKPLQERINKGTILLANEGSNPECTNCIPKTFWIEIARRFGEQGYNVVYNTRDRVVPFDGYAKWLDCSVDTCIQIALSAKRVISLRSGLCDLLHELNDRLYILSPDKFHWDYYGSIKLMFDNAEGVHEYIYSDDIAEDIINEICTLE